MRTLAILTRQKCLAVTTNLNEKLRERLEQAEAEHYRAREALRGHAAQLSQYNQVLASLKSSYDTKKSYSTICNVNCRISACVLIAGQKSGHVFRRDELHAQLSNNRSRRNQLEKALTFCEKRRWTT
ncbi:hypothetical protein ACLB1E_27205 [Escherichia coli]